MERAKNPQRPSVSVIITAGDDLETIVRTLGAALDQEYPHDRLEVIVVDRGSTDGTRDIAMRATYDRRTRLIDLPGATHIGAINHVLKAAGGDIVVALDGRTALPLDFVAACAAALEQNDVLLGQLYLHGTTPWHAANARATNFAVGAQPLAARRSAIERAGGWNARLATFSACRLPADMLLTRPGPGSLAELLIWHIERGREDAALLRQQLLPAPRTILAILVLALFASSLLAPFVRPARTFALRSGRWYALFLALMTLRAANIQPPDMPKGRGIAPPPDQLLLRLPLAFGLIHLSYGSGLLLGLLRR